MASNRSRARERSTALAAPADTASQALNALPRRAARIQIASCSAAAMTFTGWGAAARRLAQTLGERTALPRAVADHVDTRLARASTDS